MRKLLYVFLISCFLLSCAEDKKDDESKPNLPTFWDCVHSCKNELKLCSETCDNDYPDNSHNCFEICLSDSNDCIYIYCCEKFDYKDELCNV